nr:MAG TPA: DnaD like replication protein [Caudoviricetes sp.]
MADNKKYYYLKLKENFFDSDSMVLLESMQDGVLYSNILMKMYLKSLKNNGKLLLNDTIPYNTQMIATITRHQVGTVEKAIEVFNQLGLIDILDGGMIYMSDIELFVGQSSTEGDRKRAERLRLKQSDNLKIGQMSDIHPPEIEKEIEIELDKENRDKVNYQQIADMYNATCVSFPRLTVLSEKRKKAIKARLKKYSIDDIQRAFELAEGSDFLKGANGRNWSATFDWIMCDANMAKILDGNYANKDNHRTEGRDDTGGQAGRDESLTEMAIRAGIGDSFEGF